jgi:hypothetical protein
VSSEVVYVLGSPGSSIVKIGRTTNLAQRVGNIQRMSPLPLVVLWTHPGGHELETQLHRHFASKRSHGEWFVFDSGDPAQLVQDAVSQQPWRKPRKVPVVGAKAAKVKLTPPPRLPISALPDEGLSPLLTERVETLMRRLDEIPDDVDRYHALEDAAKRMKDEFRRIRQGAVLQVKEEGRSWREVGALLEVSGARAEQISRGAR